MRNQPTNTEYNMTYKSSLDLYVSNAMALAILQLSMPKKKKKSGKSFNVTLSELERDHEIQVN